MKKSRLYIGYLAVLLLLVAIGGAIWRSTVLASDSGAPAGYPAKPITIVVTFPPGGGTDLLARKLGNALEKHWHTPVVVENRPGASGNIGARYVAESKANGYTLLMVNSSFAVNPGVYKELGFDPKADFSPVINVAWIPSVVVVGQNSAASTLEQALTPVGANSNVAFASCGNGTPQHLAGEMLAERTAKALLHVPYKGCGPAVADIASGQVPMGIVTISSAMSFVQSGQLRPLAVTSPVRSPVMLTVPTVMETGVEGYELDQWHGLLAPAGTPADIIEKLNKALVAILSTEKMHDELESLGYTNARSTAGEFTAVIHKDIDRFSALTKRIGLKMN